MESLPAAGTVRRTVRVAVALVVGQALLCALIGWLTLGRGRESGSTVDQMAAPAPAAPPATSRYPAPDRSAVSTPPTTVATTADRKVVSSPTVRATSVRRAAPSDPPRSVAPPAPAPPTPAPAAPEAPALPVPTIVATTTGPSLGLVSPRPSPSVTDTAEPITVGDFCWPEGAFATTADGTLVRCLRTWHHRPRWKIV